MGLQMANKMQSNINSIEADFLKNQSLFTNTLTLDFDIFDF